MTDSSPSPAAEPASATAARDGERRQATVLFADMEGYTALAEKLGEEDTFAVMQPIMGRIVETVHAHGGTTQDLAGDGVMALFGAPHAIEDAPLRACRAALEVHRVMAQLGEQIKAKHGITPRFRVGINTGPVVIGKMGDDPRTALGDTVNIAARLEGLAEPGTVLLSDSTHRLVEGYADTTALGERKVKGKSQPIPVFRLDSLKEGVTRFDVSLSRGLTALIGRRRELEEMEAVWQDAQTGQTCVFDLVGEAGIGKSRLVHEFCTRRGHEGAYMLRGHCVQSGKAGPFHPWVEVVRTSFRIADGEAQAAAANKLHRGIEVLGGDADEGVPYLLNLLGYTVEGDDFTKENAEVAGIRTRDLLTALLSERCAASQVLLVIEDLHWIDTASEELLSRIIGGGACLMVLCDFRPQYRAPWADRDNARELRVVPLSDHSTEDLVKHRLGVEEIPGDLTSLVVEKSEGNPLFAEEITTYLMDKGVVEKVDDGLRFDAKSAHTLPVNLENIVMDRVDNLAEEPRALLQAAAVIGRRFSADVAGHAVGLNGAGAASAQELENVELIFAEPDPGEYRFKHALVRDAVYGSLLKGRRAELHGRVAEALEHKYGDRAGELADTLADHYSETPRAEKAVQYIRMAGEKALRLYSLDEAELRFRQVVELIENVPGCADDAFFADSLLNICRVLYYKADFFGLIELVEKHLPLVEGMDDPDRLGRFLFELGYAHCFSANPKTGKPLLERALKIGEDTGNNRLIAYASMGLMWEHIYWEPPTPETRAAVRRLSARALEIGRHIGDRWVTLKALIGPSIDDGVFGRPAQARREGLKAIEYSRETGDPRGRSMGLYCLAIAGVNSFDFEGAIEDADESIRLGLSPIDRMAAETGKGLALIFLERPQEGLPILQAVRGRIDQMGLVQLRMVVDIGIHLGRILTGELSKGVKELEAFIDHYQDLAPQMAAFGHLTLGDIYMRMATGQGEVSLGTLVKNAGFVLTAAPRAASKARTHLEEAAEKFRQHDAPSYLAWALLDLGLVAAKKKKKRAEAKKYFDEAKEVAAGCEAAELESRIDAALAAL
ncbi:MAG: AAA family ATPase [Proteobacteria bacterium]|nr:AAA family ATPase [Pseudomonadota bacterium]